VLLLEKLPVPEKEMQENELKELQKGEGVQVVLGEELQEELAGEELQEDVPQYDAKPPPFFIPISLNHFTK
jgi:hypothetical protein